MASFASSAGPVTFQRFVEYITELSSNQTACWRFKPQVLRIIVNASQNGTATKGYMRRIFATVKKPAKAMPSGLQWSPSQGES
jgi:hypothetical protein